MAIIGGLLMDFILDIMEVAGVFLLAGADITLTDIIIILITMAVTMLGVIIMDTIMVIGTVTTMATTIIITIATIEQIIIDHLMEVTLGEATILSLTTTTEEKI